VVSVVYPIRWLDSCETQGSPDSPHGVGATLYRWAAYHEGVKDVLASWKPLISIKGGFGTAANPSWILLGTSAVLFPEIKMHSEIAIVSGFLILLAASMASVAVAIASRSKVGRLQTKCFELEKYAEIQREEAVQAKLECDEFRVKAECLEPTSRQLAGVQVELELFKEKFFELQARFRHESSPRNKNGRFETYKRSSDAERQHIENLR
jgi:hypothetical protein